MGYLYACADFTYPLLAHDKVIQLAALLGFDGIDIGLFEGRSHIQPSMIAGRAATRGRELKKQTDASGIRVADVFLQSNPDFTPMAINHPDAAVRGKVREQFLESIEYALACETGHVTGLPGVLFSGEEEKASLGRANEEMAWRLEEAKKAGLVYSVEPHLGSIASTPQKALEMVQAVPKLTLTLDYTHFTKMGIPDAEVEPLIPYASHFHARGACKGMLQTILQENTIDYGRVVQLMHQHHYKGYIGVEYIWMEWENSNRSDNVSESLQMMRLMKSAEEKVGARGEAL